MILRSLMVVDLVRQTLARATIIIAVIFALVKEITLYLSIVRDSLIYYECAKVLMSEAVAEDIQSH